MSEFKIIPLSPKDLRCGSCAGLRNKALKGPEGHKRTCAPQGIAEGDRACKLYEPNHNLLIETRSRTSPAMTLLTAIRTATPALLQYLPQLMTAESRIRTHLKKRHLLERVYFKWQGRGSYLSNYCSGLIIDADRTHVYLVGTNGEAVFMMMMSDFKKSALTEEHFAVLKEQLLEKDKVWDPSLEIKTKKQLARVSEVPTFDQVPASANSQRISRALQQANLADLMDELSTHGTTSRTADRVVAKTVKSKSKAKADGSYSWGFDKTSDEE